MAVATVLVTTMCIAGDAPRLTLQLRTRVEAFKGSGEWAEASVPFTLEPSRTALIICDMWDKHWCRGATARVGKLVEKMDPVVATARANGVTIIHAPSDTMSYYADHTSRLKMLALAPVKPSMELTLSAPEIPVDSSHGGCDTPGDTEHRAWTREHPGLTIDARDYISDDGKEIYSLLKVRGIGTLLVMGVHTNMCILNRSFAIKQMTKWGMRCILVRDLTDAMYDPQDRPFVSHSEGTELVIQHIEKYWAPSVLSTQLVAALAK